MSEIIDIHPRVRTVWWEEEADDDATTLPLAVVRLLDQSVLPAQVVYLRLTHEDAVAEAIETLKVRGAPVIGVTAAYGLALALHRFTREQGPTARALPASSATDFFALTCQRMARTRPTAVNLFWAIERMQRCAREMFAGQHSLGELVTRVVAEAQAIAAEDVAACERMGRYGAELIADGDTLLTHCNAGALAATGIGTALAPIYTAARAGKRVHVYVDETRPVLQGARLTAWELQQEDIPLTLITDNMAGSFMRQGTFQAIFVGADRIAANGDVANKIGTYSVAVLAHVHHIPFYVVAPYSTIDCALLSGEQIPIEQRRPDEVTTVLGTRIAPQGVAVANPAFDITPHPYVTAIITDRGIARPPYTEALRALFHGATR